MKATMQPIRAMQFGFGAALVVLVIIGTVAYLGIDDLFGRLQETQHTEDTLDHIASLQSAMMSIESGYRDYALTDEQAYLKSARSGELLASNQLSILNELTADKPTQQRRLSILASLMQQMIRGSGTIVRLPLLGGPAPAFHSVLDDMRSEEHRLSRERSTDDARRFRRDRAVLMLASAAGILLIALAGFILRRSFQEGLRAESALRNVEESNRLLLKGVQDYSICMLGPDGLVVGWNAGAERIKGYEADEIIGRNFACFYPQEDIDHGQPQKDLLTAAANGRCETERWCIRKDGSRFWGNIVITAARNASGSLMGFSKITRDMTERKETEAKYRGLLEAAPDAMVVVNQSGEIVLLNLQAEKQFGYRSDELVGQLVKNIIPRGFAERLIADGTRSAAEALAQHIGMGIELRGRRKDGSDFPIEIMLSPQQSPEGILVTAAIREISVRKRAEEHLVKTVAELKRSNDELAHFAYVASHDLQEPLRMVASYTQLLAKRYRGRLDADADDFIDYAVDGCTRMQQMIRDLLAYSRAGAGQADLREISSELALHQALGDLRVAIAESHALVTYDALPAVTTDKAQLSQVFQNLIGNAIKYRGAETPRIHISATTDSGPERVFSVRDNGLGIDPQYFGKIFVLFQRLHGREEFAGTGIGLAVCKKILERLGGRIWVESQLEKGSVFHFALPNGVTK